MSADTCVCPRDGRLLRTGASGECPANHGLTPWYVCTCTYDSTLRGHAADHAQSASHTVRVVYIEARI